ncbi:uncharacterized protein TRIADDRAFT_55501 [Trichoplax adhaerens]|uniref:TIR domain-containing protein n=1 Tax=Trichoplax adhaerens TaxID=10228 RepID=B3RV25_TRIAD|nr:predicted protein [Trichoplax adhaerens]EDV25425.1 predicted protein [Trichoplax adhaerens]|eukprot:XP_002111458.1 predicted protein [Trichoplax adhaerens]
MVSNKVLSGIFVHCFYVASFYEIRSQMEDRETSSKESDSEYYQTVSNQQSAAASDHIAHYLFYYHENDSLLADEVAGICNRKGLQIRKPDRDGQYGRSILQSSTELFLSSKRIVLFLTEDLLDKAGQWVPLFADPHIQSLFNADWNPLLMIWYASRASIKKRVPFLCGRTPIHGHRGPSHIADCLIREAEPRLLGEHTDSQGITTRSISQTKDSSQRTQNQPDVHTDNSDVDDVIKYMQYAYDRNTTVSFTC